MEQQIKKEKEQFLLKVSVSVIVAMDSAPPFGGFKLILGKIKAHKMYFTTEEGKPSFILQLFLCCSLKLLVFAASSWMKEL